MKSKCSTNTEWVIRVALLSFLQFLIGGFLSAQDGSSTKITIFQPGNTSTVTATPTPEDQNLVKWNYSLLSRGVFLLNYEISLQDKITAEAGLGVTYRDFIFEVVRFDSVLEYKNVKTGLAVEGCIRFYPKGHKYFEGIYLSPGISYRNYKFGPQSQLYRTYSGYNPAFEPGYDFMDVQVKFGYQYESYWTDLMADFYIGFGYRNATVNYYQLYSVNSFTTGISPMRAKLTFLQALFGFKVGVSF